MHRLEPGSVVAGLRVERELGRGAFGVVYLAEDELIGRHVALKIVTAPSFQDMDHARDRALREARAVGRLKSPNIVTLHRVHPFDDGEGWMLEMEYVAGGSLTDLLDEKTQLEPDQAVDILRSVLVALAVAHEAGVVHGDVKPGNVLLEASGQVKLADFGLSWMMDDASISQSLSDGPVGTPIYMAPEVIMGERGRAASDLWSAGVVFHRMLSGKLPFRTKNLHDLFFTVQNAEPDALPAHVPQALQEVVSRMLQKQPEKRPAARDMLAELDRLAAAPVPASPVSASPMLTAPTLFGRDDELARLDGLLDDLGDGRGAALLLAGEAGTGKTELVRALAVNAQRRGMRAVDATVSSLEGSLRPLLRAASRVLESGAIEQLESELPGQLMRDLLEGDVDVSLNTRQQLAWAVEQLFLTIAQDQPLVLVIENAHLADPEDHKLFRELARRFARSRVLLVLTYRTHDVEASGSASHGLAGFHELASLKGMQHMNLGPISPEAVYRLLEHRVEAVRVDAEVAQRVIDLSEGNPLYAVELMRHLEEEGAIVLDGSSLKSSPAWDGPSLPGRFHELVAVRLAGLGEDQRALLDAAAVDGREFDGDALQAVSQQPLLGVLRELQRLYRESNLVEPHGEGYRFTSAVTQEVIYEEIAPALRRAIHKGLAQHLEARTDGVAPERLGMHWELAGDRARAVPHLMRAAAGAAARGENRRLVKLCERAGLTAGAIKDEDACTYLDTLLSLARAYSSLGHDEQSRGVFEDLLAASRRADDVTAARRVEVTLARVRFSSREDSDIPLLQTAAETLPACLERGEAKYLLGLHAKLQGDLESATTWLHEASREYLALGHMGHHASSLHQLGSVAWREERFDDAVELYEQSAKISASLGRVINACASEVNRVVVLLDKGELDGLDPVLERAVHTLTLEGSAMAPQAGVILSEVRYARGDAAGAVAAVDAAFDMVADLDYLPALESVWMEKCRLAAIRGLLPEARESLDQLRAITHQREHVMGQVTAECLEMQLRCFEGDFDGAYDAACTALEMTRGSQEQATLDEPGLWIAPAVLFGLAPAALPGDVDTPIANAIRAWAEPGASIPVPETLPARARAELQVVQDWLASEAKRRGGDRDGARVRAEEGLERAHALGHVWLEARVLRHLYELSGGEEQRERHAALILRVADGMDTADERNRLLEAWRIRPASK